MKRLVDSKLIKWIKSLFPSIHPGENEGDVEIGGRLTIDGVTIFNDSLELNGTPMIDFSSEQWLTACDKSGERNIRIISDDFGGEYGIGYQRLDGDNYIIGIGEREVGSDSNLGLFIETNTQLQHLIYTTKSQLRDIYIGNNDIDSKTSYLFIKSLFYPSSKSIYLTESNGGSGTLTIMTVGDNSDTSENKSALSENLFINLTKSLGNATSGQITLNGTNLPINLIAAGTLVQDSVLIGSCFLKSVSNTQLILYYQNPLGVAIEAGDYHAILSPGSNN